MEAEVLAEKETSEGIDRLVTEIDRAVELIEKLRQEKDSLSRRCEELQGQLGRKEQESSALQSERDELQSVHEENASLIRNKEEAQLKIEAMLSCLDDVNPDTM